MTCKGYKTKCFYHTPRTKNNQQCIWYNRKLTKCQIGNTHAQLPPKYTEA